MELARKICSSVIYVLWFVAVINVTRIEWSIDKIKKISLVIKIINFIIFISVLKIFIIFKQIQMINEDFIWDCIFTLTPPIVCLLFTLRKKNDLFK